MYTEMNKLWILLEKKKMKEDKKNINKLDEWKTSTTNNVKFS